MKTIVDALTLLRSGMDTQQIAEALGCSEATAYNEIHRMREQLRLSAIVYANQAKRPLIKAAGCW